MKKSILLFLLFSTVVAAYSQHIERVEPPFWWIGFEDNTLQLMIYGEDIGNTKVVIPNEAITLESTTSVENNNYLFLNLRIDHAAKPGRITLIFTPSTGKPFTYHYPLKARREGSAERTSYEPSDVIYLITPDRFVNGNPDNDQDSTMLDHSGRDIKYGRHGGDIVGLTTSLDYIKEMGFTTIWPTPMLENNQLKDSYHGYAITDFYSQDPRFGTNEEYLLFVEEAHKRELKVIIDLVFNHCGDQHWWMKDLPTKDWISNNGEYLSCNHRRVVNQDMYAAQYDIERQNSGWFSKEMPDLNQQNELVKNYLIQNSIWWVEYANLDGIRQDTYPYPWPDAMAEWTCRIALEYPNLKIVGEEWTHLVPITSYWQRGKENHDGYVSCMSSLIDFPVQTALSQALNSEEGWNSGWIVLYETLAQDFMYSDPTVLVTLIDNHDMSRAMKQFNGDIDKVKMAMGILLTLRGIPQIYYGTEVLLDHPNSDSHDKIRKEMPGGWEDHPSNAFTGEGLTAAQQEMQSYLKTLLNWRKSSKPICEGDFMHYAPWGNIYSYFRYTEDESVIVILNKGEKEERVAVDRYQERLQGATKGRNVITQEEVSFEKEFVVPPKSALIIEIL